MSAPVTRVALTFIEGRINVYLRFGRPKRDWFIDDHRRVVEFAPQAVFCRIRWEANEYGTQLWQLSVMRAATPGEPLQRISGVAPGAALLLNFTGAQKVPTVLSLIDAIEAQRIEPADVAPSYWRMAHNRLATRLEVAPYSLERHRAHLLRSQFE